MFLWCIIKIHTFCLIIKSRPFDVLMLVKVISNSNGTSKEEVERFPTLKTSVTRLGDLLDFGQLFEAFGNN